MSFCEGKLTGNTISFSGCARRPRVSLAMIHERDAADPVIPPREAEDNEGVADLQTALLGLGHVGLPELDVHGGEEGELPLGDDLPPVLALLRVWRVESDGGRDSSAAQR